MQVNYFLHGISLPLTYVRVLFPPVFVLSLRPIQGWILPRLEPRMVGGSVHGSPFASSLHLYLYSKIYIIDRLQIRRPINSFPLQAQIWSYHAVCFYDHLYLIGVFNSIMFDLGIPWVLPCAVFACISLSPAKYFSLVHTGRIWISRSLFEGK